MRHQDLTMPRSYLLDEGNAAPKGAGELGESVYGLNADFMPCVGEGISWVAVAMPFYRLQPSSDCRANGIRIAVRPMRMKRKLVVAAGINSYPVRQTIGGERQRGETAHPQV